MVDETLVASLRSYVLATFLPGEDPSSLSNDTPLISSGIIDSIAVLDMVAWIETTFKARLEQEDLGRERLDTITLIAELIMERRAR
jgi:acyl carrier protein